MQGGESPTLIVTGGGRGIGAAVARLAGAQGYGVAVNYGSDESCDQAVVADLIRSGARAVAIQADVAEEADVLQLFSTVERELGSVRALVNNAGMTGGSSRLDGAILEVGGGR